MSKKTIRYYIYQRWYHIVARCGDPNDPAYSHYGERGIKLCEEWKTFENFYNWAHKTGFKKELWLERVDNDKGYQPDNCIWATAKQQMNNTRANRWLTIDGLVKNVSQWVNHPDCVVALATIYSRLNRGWPAKEAVFGKPQKNQFQ